MENQQSLVNVDGGNDNESLQSAANNLKAIMLQKNANDTAYADAVSAVEIEMNRRSGLFGIMFPGKILKENEQLAVQNMKDVFQSRQELMQAYLNIQLKRAETQGQMIIKSQLQYYEGELSQQAMQIRTNLVVFSQKKIAEMSDTFERSRTEFAQRIDRQTKEAEKYKSNNLLYEKMTKSLDKEMAVFFSTVDELLDGFIKSLSDKLNQG